MSYRPSMSQFLIYGPTYGTPARRRFKAEGRLLPDIQKDRSKHDGFTLGFDHPHIGPDEMSAIQRRLYRDEFEIMGPSVFRVVDDWVNGYVNLKNHAAPRVRAKAARYRQMAHRAMMLVPASRRHVNPEVGEWLAGLQTRLAAETGRMSWRERIASWFVPAMIRYTLLKMRFGIGQQPAFTKRHYRTGRRGQEPSVRGGGVRVPTGEVEAPEGLESPASVAAASPIAD